MNIDELQPLNNQECAETTGGFWGMAILGTTIISALVPVVKSIWSSNSGSVKLPGGFEAKWDQHKVEPEIKGNDFKKELQKLEAKFSHLIPPFYEF